MIKSMAKVEWSKFSDLVQEIIEKESRINHSNSILKLKQSYSMLVIVGKKQVPVKSC